MSDEPTGNGAERSEVIRSLITRARAGDTSVLPELTRYLDENPGIWRWVGNLRTQTEQVWIQLFAGQELTAAESITRILNAFNRTLMGPKPTPMVRLLANRVALSWLQLHHADLDLAQHLKHPGIAPRRLDSATRRQQQFQKGYLKALAMLETVQRLIPVPQAPDGGGSSQVGPTAEPIVRPDDVLPMPLSQPNPADPARRIAAQIPSEPQAEPLRREPGRNPREHPVSRTELRLWQEGRTDERKPQTPGDGKVTGARVQSGPAKPDAGARPGAAVLPRRQ